MAEIGTPAAAAKLCSFVERIERLVEERANLNADIREVFSEVRGEGFDVKTMRQVIKLRKLETPDRRMQEELLDLYKQAVGLD